MRRLWVVLVAANTTLTASGGAQRLADRVDAVRDGAVTFHFAARPGVCGDGSRYLRIGRSYVGSYDGLPERPCEPGPVEVRITRRDGSTERVESWVGARRDRQTPNLGEASAREAAQYLIGIARAGKSSASSGAILPAVLADSAVVWPELLIIARDEQTRSHAVRRDAAFWLSRLAANASKGHRNELMDDEENSNDLKSSAIFVMSQLPKDESVRDLLDVARTNKDRHVRSQALFWLGQSGDRRALDLFEALLNP